jgi:peptide/nickel transport system substrate-binding protein
MTNRAVSIRLAAIAGIALLAAGVAGVRGARAEADKPQYGGELKFTGYFGSPATFDCHAANSVAELHRLAPQYSTLVKVSQADYPNIEPDVAESWTMSPDGMTFTFKLRQDVKFHDGTPLTSADVKATYDRIRKPPEGVVSIRATLFSDVTSVDAPDPYTVVFKLAKPNASMLMAIASPWNCLYSAKLLASDPDYPTRKVMGSGPFKFVSYVAGSDWVGARNPDYFIKGKPYLDSYRVLDLGEPGRVNALIADQYQADFRGITPAEKARVSAERKQPIKWEESVSTGLLLIAFNTRKPPFNDARVRQAMNLAIDRWGGEPTVGKFQVFSRVGGFQRAGSTFARSNDELAKLPGFRKDIAANRAEAKRLLAEAGATNLNLVFANRPTYTALGVYLIDQWRQIGVTVTQETFDPQRYAAKRVNGEFDIITDVIPDSVDDPTIQLSNFISADKNRANVAGYVDHTVDELYDKQLRTLDIGERKKIVNDLEARLIDQAYEVPMFWQQRIVPLDPSVHGFHMTPSAQVGQDLADIWLSK